MTLYVRIGLFLALTAGVGAMWPRPGSTGEQVRKIRIVAKNMTYYADGADEPNPAIRLVPDEQVRITFRNDDRGMLHDFGIPALGVATGIVEYGTEKAFTFRTPSRAAAATYTCTPHSAMMSGRIIIEK